MTKRAFIALAAGAAALAASAATALAGTTVVTPASMDGWAAVHDTCGAASTAATAFVTGPGSPPAGVGSVRFTIGSNGDSYETLRTAAYDGTKLSDLTAFDYWTYETAFGSGSQAAYIDLYVYDGTTNDILTFEPVYQGGAGTVVLATWQHWNAFGGQWWTDNAGGPPPFTTLSAYIAAHPNAIIRNDGQRNVVLATGCGGAAWTNFDGNADELTIGVKGANTTYNFEPAVGPPAGKSQCKNGGWRKFNNPSFKNQGQCVAYVNHHNGKGQDDKHAHNR